MVRVYVEWCYLVTVSPDESSRKQTLQSQDQEPLPNMKMKNETSGPLCGFPTQHEFTLASKRSGSDTQKRATQKISVKKKKIIIPEHSLSCSSPFTDMATGCLFQIYLLKVLDTERRHLFIIERGIRHLVCSSRSLVNGFTHLSWWWFMEEMVFGPQGIFSCNTKRCH